MTLKQKLDYHYTAFNRTKINPDPLQFLHFFEDPKDIEAAGFISSVFAYGSVTQIINTLEKIFKSAGNSPYNFIMNYDGKKRSHLKDIKHRFYTPRDIDIFFRVFKKILQSYGSLQAIFLRNYNPSDKNIKEALSGFSEEFLSSAWQITPGVKFMFPSPLNGSTCKRMNLFLRWMVRKDELDLGVWSKISPAKLIIPVDTHIARICSELELTTRKNPSWIMAEEITENLKKFDPADPVKYDFAICHIGIRKMKFWDEQ